MDEAFESLGFSVSCCNMVDVRPDVGQRSLAVNLLRKSSTLPLVGAVVLRRPD